MTLEEAVIQHAAEVLVEDDWYHWKEPSEYPAGVELPEGSNCARNLVLKRQLSDLYHAADPVGREKVIRFYISVWGGIKTNKDDKLLHYTYSTPENLIGLGSQGIASWSKALNVRYPEKYAIYDARVAVSLNALQVLHDVEKPKLFPLVASRNARVEPAIRRIRNYARLHDWQKADRTRFYRDYNALLARCAQQLHSYAFPVEASTIEMALFASAPDLAVKAP